jgi:putative intracellular protease/amidase
MANMCEDRAMAVFGGDGRHRVAVLARDGVLPFELSTVHRLFGQARGPSGVALYEVVTCALVPGEIRTDADFTIIVPHGPAALIEADTVIVPGSEVDYEPHAGYLEPALAAELARVRPGTRIASICTGSFVLAAAGLLDGRRATTHWRSSMQARERFPEVVFDLDVLYTDDDGILTSAGAAAGIDLCLHMIRTDHGAAVANEVARGTVVPPHREGGQAQYLQRPIPDPRISSTGWPPKNQRARVRSPGASATKSVPHPGGGSSSSAWRGPAPSSNAPTCPSTRSPSRPGSAPPAPCGCTCKPSWGPHPVPTAPRSAALSGVANRGDRC